jgi:spore coat polysaccharide biosynthesis protein SpsF
VVAGRAEREAEVNLKTLGIVQACHVAPPAHDKVGRKLGGKTLLEWVVRRATDCQRLDRVVILLGDTPGERELGRLAPPDIEVFVGPEPDALARFAALVASHAAQGVIRICADNPFVDPVLIDRLVTTAAAHPESDYISYVAGDGRPTILSPMGPFAEWCSAQAIQNAQRRATRPADRRDVTGFLYNRPHDFQIRLIQLPSKFDGADLRFRIDGQEDWECIQVIHEALGPEEWDWTQLAGLLDRPAARKRLPLAGVKESAA